ncbi:MAG: 16S rRNA processing protein RimM [Clostridia bacterium]|nr:16S rRNA processing protein RimM [Clostridia bacterium]
MDRLTVGYISKAQGVKGEVKISPLTDDASRFKKLKVVYIDGKAYAVKGVRILPNGIFMTFEGIDDRNSAELLRNKEIQIERKDATVLPKDRYFIVDVVGCEVYVDNERVGKLKDVLQYGSADVYVISTPKGNAMIPAIERIIKQVDVENKKILLDKDAWNDLVVFDSE